MPAPHSSAYQDLQYSIAMVMLSLLVVVAAVVAPALGNPLREEPPRYRCPISNYVLLEETCFSVMNRSGSWFEGQDACNVEGATLATISSDFQQDALSGE